MKPNVILITVDQMRRDCMGVAGHHTVETPNLDAMKKNGHMFTAAYSATPSCIPARVALLTGLTQRSHRRVGYQEGVTFDYPVNLADQFTKAGYHTQSIGKMHVHPPRNLCGFHNVVLHDGYLHYTRNKNKAAGEMFEGSDDYLQWLKLRAGSHADLTDMGLECNSWTARPWTMAEELHPTNWTVSQSIDFLRRRDTSKPFFMMTSFVRPHPPLDPPQWCYDMYINQPFVPPPVGDWAKQDDPSGEALNTACYRGVLNEKALRRARAAYYALITHVDNQLGRLIMALGEYNSLHNTIIIFTSDHGDMLGDHNLFRKALPYEGSAGVPFLIYDPGNCLKAQRNSTHDNVVELMDVMPTLLDAVGIDIPDTVEGKSLLPLLRGECTNWREHIHGEHSTPDGGSMHYVTNGKQKFIWFSYGREQYFDLAADPNELHDLIDCENHKADISYFRSALISYLSDREEGYTDGSQLIAGRPAKRMLSCRA